MMHDTTSTCPLKGAKCTDACAWADVVVTITDDGIERETFCAVAMAAAALMRLVGSSEECEHGLRP